MSDRSELEATAREAIADPLATVRGRDYVPKLATGVLELLEERDRLRSILEEISTTDVLSYAQEKAIVAIDPEGFAAAQCAAIDDVEALAPKGGG